jgi:uncharacterized protein YqeY
MLRQRLSEALKEAMKAKNDRGVSTVRLILAALKDRDIAARSKGVMDGVGDEEILQMLQSMVKQRRESIALYEQGNRPDLVEGEKAEIAVIEGFMPKQMDEKEMADAITSLIVELGAKNLKDMGRVMNTLKERFPGRMDFAKASGVVKKHLS